MKVWTLARSHLLYTAIALILVLFLASVLLMELGGGSTGISR